ncbi:hypothetical protein ACNOYE_28830 [Nannocystaceae bacterium ST9]
MTEIQGTPYGDDPQAFGSELSELEDNALLWLLVGAAGFWFGLGWITGPLAWYFGAQARNKYRALGRMPSSKATGAWIVGIITTVVSYVAAITLAVFLVFVGAALFGYY